MSFSKPNASSATRTKNRTPNDRTPASGICSVCVDDCPGFAKLENLPLGLQKICIHNLLELLLPEQIKNIP